MCFVSGLLIFVDACCFRVSCFRLRCYTLSTTACQCIQSTHAPCIHRCGEIRWQHSSLSALQHANISAISLIPAKQSNGTASHCHACIHLSTLMQPADSDRTLYYEPHSSRQSASHQKGVLQSHISFSLLPGFDSGTNSPVSHVALDTANTVNRADHYERENIKATDSRA